MPVTESSEQNKVSFFRKKSTAYWYNYILANSIVSIFFIIVGLILLFNSASHLYGIMIGLIGNWLSIGAIILLVYMSDKILKPKGALNIWITYFFFAFIRTLFFLVILLIPLILLNDALIENENGVKLIIEPVNIIFIMICYQTLMMSFVLGNFIKK